MARTFTLGQLTDRCKHRTDQENSSLISTAEWQGLISSAYAELYSLIVSSGMRYFEREQTISTVAATYATGRITTVAKSSLVDGEQFTLDDGYGKIVFEFDVAGTGVTAGTTSVDVSGDTTAEQVEARIITAVNAANHDQPNGTAFKITASDGGSGIVTLTHDETGAIGNARCYETVANTGFLVRDMTGGGVSYRIPPDHLSTVSVEYVVNSTTGERRPLFETMAQERTMYNSQASSSEAESYAIADNYLFLYPTPPASQTYKHVYVAQPLEFTAATTSQQVDVITPDGENFIVWSVAVNAFTKEESWEAAALARQERERYRGRVEEWAVLRAINTPRRNQVGGGPNYRDPADWYYR